MRNKLTRDGRHSEKSGSDQNSDGKGYCPLAQRIIEKSGTMTLSRHLLERTIDGYDSMDGLSEEEYEYLRTLPEAFDNGTWTYDDVEWVVRWKSSRSIGYFKQNDPDEVTECIERTLDAESVTRKIEILTRLDGVAVRMASALLLFMEPDRFTVLDWRAWDVLHQTGYLLDEMPDNPGVEEYLLFLGASWALANEYDVSLRTLDMVLWTLGGQE